jgi:hypothetical protein
VFLNGKPHVDYRRGLNSLFTRKALAWVSILSVGDSPLTRPPL